MTKTKKPEAPSKSRRLEVVRKLGQTDDRLATDMVADGEVMNACTALRFVNAEHGELSLTDMVASLREHGLAVNRGELAAAERMLNSQAVALNAMFAELARRGAANMGTHLPAAETYLRLALKAQAQSRATVETLAAIKNPPVVFARQANINNGGQQQVNNAVPAGASADKDLAPTHMTRHLARAPVEIAGLHSELLEDQTHGGTQVDNRTKNAAGGTNQSLEPLDTLNRAAHR